MYDDTIVALATSPGEAAIGIVRMSGANAPSIAAQCFRHGLGLRAAGVDELHSHVLHYGAIVDPVDQHVIDEVLIARMSAPRSYTREEIIEISCHGGSASVQSILALCLRLGARAAEPGEFTLRAFANGRIDLSQAEAVAGIVSAKTSSSLDLAVSELRGKMSERLRPARDLLVGTLAFLDASADFPDDEIPAFEPGPALTEARATLSLVMQSGRVGRLYEDGIRIALVGRPNVGKSSLLNVLLRSDRAIVTPIAGTTRDVISEMINLRGIPATLLDTAGIAESEDLVEQLGIDRSRHAMEASGIVVMVMDRSLGLQDDDRRVVELLRARSDDHGVIVALNKADLPSAGTHAFSELPPLAPIVEVSAVTGVGLAELEDVLYRTAVDLAGDAAEPALVTERQLDALRRSVEAIEAGTEALQAGQPLDIVAIDIREALDAIGEITGENVSEAVLDEIFRRFCIGK